MRSHRRPTQLLPPPEERHVTTDDLHAALGGLAAQLDAGQFAATLVTPLGRMPHLTVTNRHATRLSERIYAGHGSYWWSWAERISPLADPWQAAAKIAHVLHAADQPWPSAP
jgi:hypothetical protein